MMYGFTHVLTQAPGNKLFRVTPPKETAGLGGLTPYTIGFNGHLHIHPRDTLANLGHISSGIQAGKFAQKKGQICAP